jgi:hypothetical protein
MLMSGIKNEKVLQHKTQDLAPTNWLRNYTWKLA